MRTLWFGKCCLRTIALCDDDIKWCAFMNNLLRFEGFRMHALQFRCGSSFADRRCAKASSAGELSARLSTSALIGNVLILQINGALALANRRMARCCTSLARNTGPRICHIFGDISLRHANCDAQAAQLGTGSKKRPSGRCCRSQMTRRVRPSVRTNSSRV